MRRKRKRFHSKDKSSEHLLESFSLSSVHAFSFDVECHKLPDDRSLCSLPNRYALPELSPLCQEEPFAKVALGWSEKGICCSIRFGVPFVKGVFPQVEKGDGVELFFDTRDIKETGFNHRFCHHFVFVPQEGGGVECREVTRFRTDDGHAHCESKFLEGEVVFSEKSYTMNIWIPSESFHGYESDFGRMGFTYLIHRAEGAPQHFSIHSKEFLLEYQPALWSTLKWIA